MDLAIFFGAFFFLVIVIGPIFGAESRPGFKRPDQRPEHQAVGDWFAERRLTGRRAR